MRVASVFGLLMVVPLPDIFLRCACGEPASGTLASLAAVLPPRTVTPM